MMTLQQLLLVGAGGFLGSVARYLLSKMIDGGVSRSFPFGTLTVNILGSFLLGIVYAIALKKAGNAETVRLLVGIGFCGGFTTFSTFALENFLMTGEKNLSATIIYIASSVILAILAVWTGFSAARSW